MKPYQRIFLIILGTLAVLTGAGLVLTSDWGAQMMLRAKPQSGTTQYPVDMQQFQTAQSLAQLATTPQEQARARDALRIADHEVDFAFTTALYQATSQPIPSTPEINAIVARIATAQKKIAEINADVAHLTRLLAGAIGNKKEIFAQQLELAKARLELNQDELADAGQDLERAGGDPQSRIQRMVDEHKALDQNGGGQVDLSIVGRQASTTMPVSSAFLSRARAWFVLHSMVKNLDRAEQDAAGAAATFSSLHDKLERQLEEAQSQQSKQIADASSGTAPGGTASGRTERRTMASGKSAAGASSSTPDQTPD